MMKKAWLQRLTAVALGVMLLLAPMSVRANIVTGEQYQAIHDSAQLIEETMQRIMEKYVGGDVSVEELRDAALKGMTSILDPYSEYMTSAEYASFFNGLSASAKAIGVIMGAAENEPYIRVVRVLDNSPAKEAGILPGDLLITANGVSLKNKTASDVRTAIAADTKETVTVVVRRGTKDISFTLTPREVYVSTVQTASLKDLGVANPSPKAGYLQITTVGDNCAEDFAKELAAFKKAGVKRLLLDLRGNSGGYLDDAIAICRLLVPAGPIIYTYDADNGMVEIASTLAKCPFDKIVVLTNSGTASAAEVIASALQDSKAGVVVGSLTYGKGVIQSLYPYRSGGGLKITVQEYFRRSKAKLDGIGITPDVDVQFADYVFEESSIQPAEREAHQKNLKVVLSMLGFADAKAFQISRDLGSSGVVDGYTANALNRAIDAYYAAHDVVLTEGYKTLMK